LRRPLPWATHRRAGVRRLQAPGTIPRRCRHRSSPTRNALTSSTPRRARRPVARVHPSRRRGRAVAASARWTREDGLPFDPWMRLHTRLGAEILAVAERSLDISGSVAEWESWTDLSYPEDGDYSRARRARSRAVRDGVATSSRTSGCGTSPASRSARCETARARAARRPRGSPGRGACP
jgi:hypothetical protein